MIDTAFETLMGVDGPELDGTQPVSSDKLTPVVNEVQKLARRMSIQLGIGYTATNGSFIES
jgi:hypothetical protein